MAKMALAVHGGAGTIDPDKLNSQLEQAYKAGLEEALSGGFEILQKGNSALDAVEVAVKSLENFHLFNAGKGSVFTNTGSHEMGASIMCGKTLKAGAVAGVKNIKNPVELSRMVMEKTEFVMLMGEGAETFAKEMNLETQPDDYFFTQHRFDQWKQIKDSKITQLDHSEGKSIGTVGAVAIDQNGNLAAATSTGGMTNKKWGRIGDTAIIGSGTYANNNSCAVSCTGHGEYFIRSIVAFDISCHMIYKGLKLEEACHLVVMEKLKSLGGEGGVIAVDKNGNFSLTFNSPGMYRGAVSEDFPLFTAIFK
jgi:beta-aspartyl-peptidase (threonine type)